MVGPGKGKKFVFRDQAEKARIAYTYNKNASKIPHDQQIVRVHAGAKGVKGMGQVDFPKNPGKLPDFRKKKF